jgi:hypothetical protein
LWLLNQVKPVAEIGGMRFPKTAKNCSHSGHPDMACFSRSSPSILESDRLISNDRPATHVDAAKTIKNGKRRTDLHGKK